jgi:hypothetical protein
MAMPRKLGQRWWRKAAIITAGGVIIAALITAIGTISVAFIQRNDPKPKLSEPTKIEQQTHGSGSPAIGQTGGNVTIQQQGSGQKP